MARLAHLHASDVREVLFNYHNDYMTSCMLCVFRLNDCINIETNSLNEIKYVINY